MTDSDNTPAQFDVEAAQLELGFGLYQVRFLILILIPMLVNAMHNSNYVFAAADVEYRCKVPECETEPIELLPGQWSEWALPRGEDARCHRYKPVTSSPMEFIDGSFNTRSSIKDESSLRADTCTPQHFTMEQELCDSWVYGSNKSIVAEFNLACEDWKRTLVGTVHSAGIFFALTFIGFLSDRFGRLPIFVATAVSSAVTGVARAFSQSYLVYIILEFIEPLLGSGVYTTGCVLVMEMMTRKRRVLTSTLLPISYSLGHVLLAGLAWVLPGWRELLLALYLPSGLFLSYCLLLDESPRWLAACSQNEKAAKVLLRAAKLNGVTFSPKMMQQLTHKSSPSSISPSISETKRKKELSVASQIVRSKLLMCRLAMCGFWWITCALVFYGLSINSVSLSGNKYVNFILSSIAEIPGYTLTVISLDRFGRRTCLGTSFLMCGVALISLPLIPAEMGSVILVLTLVGKVWISMAFGNIYVFTSEIFPTQARHSMLAASSMIGRIGQILAPQTPLLIKLWRPLPYVTFGAVAGVAALLTLVAPETRHTSLPDTVEEAEQLHKERNRKYVDHCDGLS